MTTDNKDSHGNDDHGKDNVSITINNQPYTIHRGHQTVAAIKNASGVAAAEELEQIVNGVFKPLADDGAVTIKGGEIFVSHVRASAAA